MKYDTSTIEGKIQVMERYREDPKRLHIYTIAGWRPYNNDCEDPPGWNWIEFHYNYPAEPTLKPWTFETAPKVGVLFEFENVPKNYYVPNCFTPVGVAFNFQAHVEPYEALLKGAKYSLDAGKTWQPCGTYEN